jgi:hypothetical protein
MSQIQPLAKVLLLVSMQLTTWLCRSMCNITYSTALLVLGCLASLGSLAFSLAFLLLCGG